MTTLDPNNPFSHLMAAGPAAAPAAPAMPSAPPPMPQVVIPAQIKPTETPEYKASIVRAETKARLDEQRDEKQKEREKTPEQKMLSNFKFGETLGTIRRAIEDVSSVSAGFGAYTQNVPYAPAQSLASDIQTIKANIGFDKLQEIRDASQTHGALGQVAVRELDDLQASIASLDPSLPPDRLKANLRKVEYHYANVQRIVGGGMPYSSMADYYKDLSKQKQAALSDVKTTDKAKIVTDDMKTIEDPARKGLNSKIRARIQAGQTAEEIVSYLDGVVPGLGQTLSTQVDAATKYRQEFPDTSMSKYPIDVERVKVPASATQQFLGKVAKSAVGGYLTGAASGLTAGTLAQMTENPELTNAALAGIAEESPISSFIGEATGAGLSMIPAVRLGRVAGLGARGAEAGASTLYGGIYGGATGEGDLPTDIALGAAGGLIGQFVGEKAAAAMGRIAAPQIDKAVSLLAEKKIPMTMGQMLGGIYKDFEDKLQSVPLTGFIISKGRSRGLDGAQRAVVNEALSPLGKSLPKDVEVGTSAMKYTQDAFDDAYDSVRSRMMVRRDRQLTNDLTALVDSATTGGELTSQQATQLRRVVKSRVFDRLRKNKGELDGALYKQTSSELKKLARENYGTPFGSRVNDVRAILDEAAGRVSPRDAVSQLAKIDEGYAKLVIIENAAKMRAGGAGVFSPTQLESAVQRGDFSARNRAFARGEAALQDMSGAMRKVLPSSINDSGTAPREAVVTGNVGALAKLASPVFAAGATEPGQAFTQWLLMTRPDLLRKFGLGLQSQKVRAAGRAAGTVYGAKTGRTSY